MRLARGWHERNQNSAGFRGLSDREFTGFLLVLEWFENLRLRYELAAGREAARVFWKPDSIRFQI